jgi:hypothetical protein
MSDKKRKIKYDCKIDGVILVRAGVAGVCPKSIVGGGCGAHGNTKCAHKVAKTEDDK